VVAVKAALRNRTGVWFGWSGKIDETATAEPRIVERNHITYAVIDLSKNDFEEYYNGLAIGSYGRSCITASICRNTRAPTFRLYARQSPVSPTSSARSSERTTSFGCTTTI